MKDNKRILATVEMRGVSGDIPANMKIIHSACSAASKLRAVDISREERIPVIVSGMYGFAVITDGTIQKTKSVLKDQFYLSLYEIPQKL